MRFRKFFRHIGLPSKLMTLFTCSKNLKIFVCNADPQTVLVFSQPPITEAPGVPRVKPEASKTAQLGQSGLVGRLFANSGSGVHDLLYFLSQIRIIKNPSKKSMKQDGRILRMQWNHHREKRTTFKRIFNEWDEYSERQGKNNRLVNAFKERFFLQRKYFGIKLSGPF